MTTMKETMIGFGVISIFVAVMLFGSIGLSRLVRWFGWPQECLSLLGIMFVLLAGLSFIGWRFGEHEDDELALKQVGKTTEKRLSAEEKSASN